MAKKSVAQEIIDQPPPVEDTAPSCPSVLLEGGGRVPVELAPANADHSGPPDSHVRARQVRSLTGQVYEHVGEQDGEWVYRAK